jgi:hypothetical protein
MEQWVTFLSAVLLEGVLASMVVLYLWWADKQVFLIPK